MTKCDPPFLLSWSFKKVTPLLVKDKLISASYWSSSVYILPVKAVCVWGLWLEKGCSKGGHCGPFSTQYVCRLEFSYH